MPVPALVAVRPTVSGPASTSISALRTVHRIAVNALVLALMALLLVAHPQGARTQGTAPAQPAQQPVVTPKITRVATTATRIRSALSIARNQKGDPYRYGAAGPNAFDCSGLVYYSTHRAGFGHVPRTSSAQSRFMRHIRRSAMRPGDFVFFYDGGGVYHVGIFTGWDNGRRQIVHAPYSGTRVRRDPIWTDRWFPGTLRR
jgi:cell wall-associated NlpC family hydrolase